MASLSPQGERAILALVADLYAQIVELREALAEANGRLQERDGPQ